MSVRDLIDWLFGCPHRRTTFPRSSETGAHSETYLVCLACGHHIPYDWGAMRRKQAVWNWLRSAPKQIGD